MKLGEQWIRLTLILVAMYLVFRYWKGATNVIRASGNAYTNSVKALQGR